MRVITCLGLLMAITAMPAGAKLTPWQLERFVACSDVIVLGSVRLLPGDLSAHDRQQARRQIEITPDLVLHGEPQTKIHFENDQNQIEGARFTDGERVLLFLRRYKGALYVVQGHAGKVLISEGRVKNLQMIDRPVEESLESFQNAIRKLLPSTTQCNLPR